MTLDTRVDGDVGTVRDAADGVAAIGGAVEDAGTGFGLAGAESETLWQGPAATAFRSRITTARQATAAAAAAGHRMAAAMHTFADRMTQVHAEIAHAKSIAQAAGLSVAGDTIAEPTRPPAPPVGCCTPQAAAAVAHQQAAAEARYRRQVTAYRQAEQVLAKARETEQRAHQDVGRAADEEKGVLADLNEHKYWLLGGLAAGTVALGGEQRATWASKTQELGLEYDRLRRDAAAVDDPALKTTLSAEADQALDRTAKAADATVGNAHINGVSAESTMGKVLRRLPDGIAAAQGVVDVVKAHGTKGKVVAAAADAAGYGAGEGVTAGGAALLETMAIGGAPETMGLSIAAAAAAYGTGYLVQHYGPAAYDWAGQAAGNAAHWTADAAGNVADAVTHPGHTVSSLADDMGGIL
jgi:hypothetical protein